MHLRDRQLKRYFSSFALLLIASSSSFRVKAEVPGAVSAQSISAQSISGQTVSVQIETTKLRSAPQAWARAVADLNYGDTIAVSTVERGWIKGSTRNATEGFVHESAVTAKKILLKSVAASLNELTVDESDVYLAGKGFNVSTEQALAKKDAALNYSAVDEMIRAARIAEPQIETFIAKGKLAE